MPETEFKYDVFVSYNSANKEWVRKTFVPILENSGLKVYEYYRDFDAGAPIVMGIENAILESRKTIPILSPGYLKSGWTEFESLVLQTLDPANRERRLLPVILENCELPPRIKYINCINFSNPDDVEMEWKRLSKALGATLLSPNATPPVTGSREGWHLAHPYPMPPNFTGRATELKMLDDWLADTTNRLFILRALGGFGKSALAWQWINTHVNPAEWRKLVWWSFYEGDASFEHFIEETLKYLKIEVPQGQRPQVDALLKGIQSQKILLIVDGFERALRAYSSMNAAYQGDESPLPEGEGKGDSAYDCVNINAEIFLKSVCTLPNIKSKVLMTTRLTPRAVKPRGEFMLGCRELELTSMQPADAVEFFHKQGIKGTHTEIETACAPYGFHPLSLRLLAGRILKDFETPADIVVAQKLKIDGDIIQQKHHVLEVSYNSLPERERKLLSTIACFRSPVELQTLQTIAENKDTLGNDLQDIRERGLLHFDEKETKFDLHPIVRRYAYERLTTPDRTDAHTRLIDYFAAVPEKGKFEKLEDLAPVIELYHHMVRAGKLDDAVSLFYERMHDPLYYQFGSYQTMIELFQVLFPNGEGNLPVLKRDDYQAWTLSALANAYAVSGQLRRSVPLTEQHNKIYEKKGNKRNLAIGLGNVAYFAQLLIGDLSDAEHNLRRSIDLSHEVDDKFLEAIDSIELGRILSYEGKLLEAGQEIDKALIWVRENHQVQVETSNWAYKALRFMMLARLEKSKIEHVRSAIHSAKYALELAENRQKQIGRPNARDFTRAHWLLGAAYRLNGQHDFAEQHLSEALTRDRAINLVEVEADILLDLARLSFDYGLSSSAQDKLKHFEEAKSLADEALLITERCGYVLQGADVNLFLAQYALEQEKDKKKAKEYAETALKLAYCDGPPYYYKVAYEEAERFLARLQE